MNKFSMIRDILFYNVEIVHVVHVTFVLKFNIYVPQSISREGNTVKTVLFITISDVPPQSPVLQRQDAQDPI